MADFTRLLTKQIVHTYNAQWIRLYVYSHLKHKVELTINM